MRVSFVLPVLVLLLWGGHWLFLVRKGTPSVWLPQHLEGEIIWVYVEGEEGAVRQMRFVGFIPSPCGPAQVLVSSRRGTMYQVPLREVGACAGQTNPLLTLVPCLDGDVICTQSEGVGVGK